MAPKGNQDVLSELAQALEPGAFGQGAQKTRGQILIPSSRACQLVGIDAAEEGGKHEAEDFAEQLLLGTQAAFDLGDQVVGQAEVVEGLMQGLDIALGLPLLAFVALFGIETAPFDGFGLFFGVSSGWGHGKLLRTVWSFRLCAKKTMPQ